MAASKIINQKQIRKTELAKIVLLTLRRLEHKIQIIEVIVLK